MDKINLNQKLALISEHWKPHIVGELNGQQVKLVKFKGPFTWHHHDNEDELFLVIKGRFRMDFREVGPVPPEGNEHENESNRERSIWLEEGELIIVSRGVEHRPIADEEAHVLLFEPSSTLNTGNVENELTVPELKRL
jgi:mannose-6-phosphate isomerase-like protein (cupin superfamily)